MVILKNNLKRIFLNKSNFIYLFIIPIIFSIFLLKSNIGTSTAYIGVYTEDNSEVTSALIKSLKVDFRVLEIDKESDIDKKLLNNILDMCLVLKKGAGESLLKGEVNNIQLIEVKEREDLKVLNQTMEHILNRYATIGKSSNNDEETMIVKVGQIDKNLFEKNIEDISKGKGTRKDSSMAMGLLVLSIMSVSFFGFIVEDKEEGRIERLMTTPMSIKSYHMQNLLTYFLVTVMSTLILLIYQINILGANIKGSYIIIFIILASLGLVCTAECIFVSSISKDTRQFYVIQALIYTPSTLLAGCYFPRNMMPETLQNISNIVPATWALKAVDKVVYSAANVKDIWIELIILVLLAIIFFLLASWKKVDLLK